MAFFGTWLGYILSADAVVLYRTGTSPLLRARWAFVGVFAISVPFWWIYEGLNLITDNWDYAPRHWEESAGSALLFSLDFATVLPGLFVTAELVRSIKFFGMPWSGGLVPLAAPALRSIPIVGLAALTAVLMWPHLMYPLVWLVLFLLLDPVNALAGRPSLFDNLIRGRWDTIVTLSAASPVCGFLWEMWNSRSSLRWIYHVPGFEDSVHLFQMPLVGYAGYVPFIWSAYAAYHFVRAPLRLPHLRVGADD
ncbi:hypothetical protein [Streptomyces wuyuanensis]|uniref:hypothetical protein n=1 Tax=Streptomyces wuyuanensis TaxID=1196353 RepID=UPI003434081B